MNREDAHPQEGKQARMTPPTFFSVITVHHQDFNGLATTYESIKHLLRGQHVEWIVIDNASKPSDSEEQRILETTESAAQVFISEPDGGIYDAMNKGLKRANGEYLLFLNAGDRLNAAFSPATLKSSLGASRPDMIWGRARWEYPDGSFGVKKQRGPNWLIYGIPVCHQAVFFSSSIFKELMFDTSYEIAGDYDFLARAIKSGAQTHLIPDIICEFAAGGLSQRNRMLALKEEARARIVHYRIPAILNDLIVALKYVHWSLSDRGPGFFRFWRKFV